MDHHHLTLSSFSVSSGEECLTLALKSRCQNQLKRRQAGPERLIGNGHGRLSGGSLRSGTISGPVSSASRLVERAVGGLCEIHFLPLVVGVGDSNRTQRLRCVGKSELIVMSRVQQMNPLTNLIAALGKAYFVLFCWSGFPHFPLFLCSAQKHVWFLLNAQIKLIPIFSFNKNKNQTLINF